jgi:CHAT domain-containing protein
MDQLEEMIQPSRFRERPIELLTLSACRTAAGDDRAALGLAGVAIKAGARSALASLWYINDPASSLLVTEFYHRLRGGKISKAEALQQAQLTLLQDPRYRHPGYWSPFLILGNWL